MAVTMAAHIMAVIITSRLIRATGIITTITTTIRCGPQRFRITVPVGIMEMERELPGAMLQYPTTARLLQFQTGRITILRTGRTLPYQTGQHLRLLTARPDQPCQTGNLRHPCPTGNLLQPLHDNPLRGLALLPTGRVPVPMEVEAVARWAAEWEAEVAALLVAVGVAQWEVEDEDSLTDLISIN